MTHYTHAPTSNLRFGALRFAWSVWMTNWRSWALLLALLVGGLVVPGNATRVSPATLPEWVERACAATRQDERAAAWCLRNAQPRRPSYDRIGAWPAFMVGATALAVILVALVAALIAA